MIDSKLPSIRSLTTCDGRGRAKGMKKGKKKRPC